MKKRILAAFAALAVLFGISLATAPVASAGALCDATGICGSVIVNGGSAAGATVTGFWPPRNTVYVPVGSRSEARGVKDADGFLLAGSCYGRDQGGKRYNGGTWHKIADGQWVRLTVYC